MMADSGDKNLEDVDRDMSSMNLDAEEVTGSDDSSYEDDMDHVIECLIEERNRRNKKYEELVSPVDLPKEVRRRIRALRNNQLEITKVEVKFHQEVFELECKYLNEMKEHFDKRRDIVDGTYEPTAEECDVSIGLSDDIASEIEDVVVKSEDENDEEQLPAVSKGIPYFWTNVFHNSDMLMYLSDEPDGPIMEHLIDIQVEMTKIPMGFKLHFHFSPNEFFSNPVLTKSYEMKCEMNPNDPFPYDGTVIHKCKGCTIDWKDGKDVTVKTLLKRQKHKQTGVVRVVKKDIQMRSFFQFFSPPIIPENPEEIDDETHEVLNADFEIGQHIREKIVPQAVLYYTGEIQDYEDDDSSQEESYAETEEYSLEDEAEINGVIHM